MSRNTFRFKIPDLDRVCSERDFKDASRVLSRLSYYLLLKGQAQKERVDGNKRMMLKFEDDAEHVYGTLPDWAKW